MMHGLLNFLTSEQGLELRKKYFIFKITNIIFISDYFKMHNKSYTYGQCGWCNCR
jgi:hypothetical protein